MTSITSAMGVLAAFQATPSAAQAASAASDTQPTSTATAGPVPDVATGVSGASALFQLGDGVSQALSAADAAGAAGRTVLGLLQTMRDAAGQAADPSTSDTDRAGLEAGFQAAAGAVAPTLAGATVNGTNLLDGSASAGLKVPLGGGATASLAAVDLTLGGSTLNLRAGANVATASAASSTFLALGGAIGAASSALAGLQGQADQLDAHVGFVQQLGQALAAPDAGDGDGARLLALNLGQQLSAQGSSIANAQPQAVLSLFRS